MTADRSESSARQDDRPKFVPSPELAAIVGDAPLTQAEAVALLWDYIKARELQDPNDKRRIMADAKLARLFGAEDARMFEMNQHLNNHLR